MPKAALKQFSQILIKRTSCLLIHFSPQRSSTRRRSCQNNSLVAGVLAHWIYFENFPLLPMKDRQLRDRQKTQRGSINSQFFDLSRWSSQKKNCLYLNWSGFNLIPVYESKHFDIDWLENKTGEVRFSFSRLLLFIFEYFYDWCLKWIVQPNITILRMFRSRAAAKRVYVSR